MIEALICTAVRTPIGRHRGVLKDVRADDLAAVSVKEVVARSRIPADRVEEVILGCANQAGEDNRNVARMASLLAGLPQVIPAMTVNRLCGSGLEAIAQACRLVRTGEADLVIAGGVESMTRAPWVMPKPSDGFPTGKLEVYDTSLGWRFPNPRLAAMFPLEQMGETAENVAEKYKIRREEQDAFALESHRKAVKAWKEGRFADEIVAVEIPQKKGPAVKVERDEGPREDSSMEKLASLKPVFRDGGTVTAGNASPLNDGSSAVLVTSPRAAKEYGLTPIARYVASASAGVDPRFMGIGPVPASQKALRTAGWKTAELDLVELNEAFAAQSLACLRDLELDPLRVNVNGGAIALGHPLGCSGSRILTTLVHEMRRSGKKRGLATMCIGVGQGIAMLVERA
jgi:3-oxoadipyl-CoA thiolase